VAAGLGRGAEHEHGAEAQRVAVLRFGDGRLRPLGIASPEGKVIQRAVCEVPNAVCETDVKGFSYGRTRGSCGWSRNG
jgi:hypothetical protein